MIETAPLPRRLMIGLKLAALAPAFLLGLPAQWLALRVAPPLARWMPVIFHRYLLFVLGVRIERHGRLDPRKPLRIAANPLSWLDIVVISAVAPVSFIAKSEVATWPLFGTLARLQRSVFVERQRRGKTGEVNREIAARLRGGDALVLFAEGTTSDGTRILPFRTALIGAAQAAIGGEGGASHVQSLNIAYPRIGGLPAGRAGQPLIAWYGDMDLVPHLKDVLTLPGIDVRVTFGAARAVGPGCDRKALAREMEQEVRQAHVRALTGRDPAQNRMAGASPLSEAGAAG
ncbi:MAG: 1-acyl-sn-glycerol-3-phosphate acyltransferase [Hyphomicrobiales bacterium]|nr:1-acyl-sn-glycerol-3-phosphate acyltransferase [Hyphomicrobiales bacterium]